MTDTPNPFDLHTTSPQAEAPTAEAEIPSPEAEAATTPADPVAELSQALQASEAKYADLYNQFIRLSADFDNVRKRRQAERDQWLKYGAEPTLQTLLPVLDNINRATSALNDTMEPAILLKSIGLIQHQLDAALNSLGLSRMATQGQAFDANLHEAVASHPTADAPEGHIVMEQQAGYHYHDKVLRPALVVVATSPQTADAEADAPAPHTVDTTA
jgi:molecular chaperone GrpE